MHKGAAYDQPAEMNGKCNCFTKVRCFMVIGAYLFNRVLYSSHSGFGCHTDAKIRGKTRLLIPVHVLLIPVTSYLSLIAAVRRPIFKLGRSKHDNLNLVIGFFSIPCDSNKNTQIEYMF